MKNLIFIASLAIGYFSNAAVQAIMINAKVKSFDMKTVTLEILNENYIFDRKKLGVEFRNLKTGDLFNIEIDKKFLKK